MLRWLLLSFALPLVTLNSSARDTDDMSGTWDIKARFSIEGGPGDGQSTDMKAVLVLVEKDRKLTGKFTPYASDGKTAQPTVPIADGRVNGNKISFRVKQDDTSLAFALVLVDGQLRGDATSSKTVEGGKLIISLTASRRK